MFAPLQTRPSLPAEIASRIAAEIASGRLAPGSQLPPEHVFTEQFGVSRATIREAVAALRSEGLIVPKQGLGTFVASGPLRRTFRINPDDLQSVEDMLQLIELRSSVEVDAAGLAAERRQKPHLDRMAALLDQIDAAIARKESATELDFEFHRAVADATGNPYFRRFSGLHGADCHSARPYVERSQPVGGRPARLSAAHPGGASRHSGGDRGRRCGGGTAHRARASEPRPRTLFNTSRR